MRHKLPELDPAQRAEVEEASRILCRARATCTLPLTDITLPRHPDRMTATRTQAMLAARAKASQDKRQRTLAAIRVLEAAATPVTATADAPATGVSTWLVYSDGVREQLEAAPRRQAGRGNAPCPTSSDRGEPVTRASLRTDLTIARDAIRRLRAERDKLRTRLRLQLADPGIRSSSGARRWREPCRSRTPPAGQRHVTPVQRRQRMRQLNQGAGSLANRVRSRSSPAG